VDERRYRLRSGSEIAGYLRDIHGTLYYSRDGFWWTGRPVEYEHVDEWTGWKDAKGKRIYEWDLVRYVDLDNQTSAMYAVLWESNEVLFGLRNVETGQFLPLSIRGVDLFDATRCTIVSHVFINPELMEAWNLQDE
jgi:hypothetical protein